MALPTYIPTFVEAGYGFYGNCECGWRFHTPTRRGALFMCVNHYLTHFPYAKAVPCARDFDLGGGVVTYYGPNEGDYVAVRA